MTLQTSKSIPMPIDKSSWKCSHCKYDLIPGQVHLRETTMNELPILRMWLCDRCWTTFWKGDINDPGQWTSNKVFYGDTYQQHLQDGDIQASEGLTSRSRDIPTA
jgi:hypothetical protein